MSGLNEKSSLLTRDSSSSSSSSTSSSPPTTPSSVKQYYFIHPRASIKVDRSNNSRSNSLGGDAVPGGEAIGGTFGSLGATAAAVAAGGAGGEANKSVEMTTLPVDKSLSVLVGRGGAGRMDASGAADLLQQQQQQQQQGVGVEEDGSFGERVNSVIAYLGGFFRSGMRSDHAYTAVGEARYPRRVPIKVEPKVYFANERTFLAWLHMSVTLASISVAIVAFAEANEWSQIYGLMLMPCAIAFCGYSLWMYIKRARMIRRKDPGPYEDRLGPIVLSGMLGISIIVNFFVKLFELSRR